MMLENYSSRKPRLYNKTAYAAVLGWPISHSKSPLMHNYWLEKLKIDGLYLPFPVPLGEFKTVVYGLKSMGFLGANVTLPHKEEAYKICDEISPIAEKIGAVNTLVFEKNKIRGLNTDAFGFAENLRSSVPSWAKGKAVVLGAGGACRAVLYALQQEAFEDIILLNRTEEKAHKLAAEFQFEKGVDIKVFPWSQRSDVLKNAQLLVNTTALGMVGQPSLDIDLSVLSSDALVTDLVYTPLQTNLLKQADEQGLKTVDGLGMLIHQARPAFEAWFGSLPCVDKDLRHLLLS